MKSVAPTLISLTSISPIQSIRLPHWPNHAPSVWVKRDDLLHPIVSGNKWRKLKYQPIEQHKHVVSLGGGYSNHLHALGYLCHQSNVKLTAIIRGHYELSPTPMLKDLLDWGCELLFLDKKRYKQRETAEFLSWVSSAYPGALFIPEGGSTQLALKGVTDVIGEVNQHFEHAPTHYFSPVASGATLAGLIEGLAAPSTLHPETKTTLDTQTIGIAVLNGEEYLEQQVSRFLSCANSNWRIEHGFVHGGYAKQTNELKIFMDDFISATHIPIEPVYSAKMFFALNHMIMNSVFKQSDRILALHTGGLQGAR